MTVVETTCRICGTGGPHTQLAAREMMYGSREPFEYEECAACGSVQIATILSGEELARHYPSEYYAFAAPSRSRLKRWADDQRTRHLLGAFNPVGALRARQRPDPALPPLATAGLQREERILDVGCGDGALLDQLARVGFQHLRGADPFIPAATTTPAGVRIHPVDIDGMDGEWDVIMFNHSLEHVPDPLATLLSARKRLAPGGKVYVRLPTTESDAYEEFGVDWVQLDPPRHLTIPSRRGMATLAERAELRLVLTLDDSSAFQFVWSELYQQDIGMLEPEAAAALGSLSPDKVASYDLRAAEVNSRSRGDQALFVLTI